MMFCSQYYPRSCSPCRNASNADEDGEPVESTPIRGTFFACCASALTAIASSITATAMDRTAALFIVSLISSVMYHADRSEEKRYSQAEATLNGKVSHPSLRKAPPSAATSHDIERAKRAGWLPARKPGV